MSVVIVGGGIAGFSLSRELATRGLSVTLLEKEALAFSHSSSRNAAIYRPLEESATITRLATRTRRLFDSLSPNLVRTHGLILCAHNRDALGTLRHTARAESVTCSELSPSELWALAPGLKGGSSRWGILLAEGGTIDVHALCTAVRQDALSRGVRVLVGQPATRLCVVGGRVVGVETPSTRVSASTVVLAAGAWAGALASQAGLSLQLTPFRRHLAKLEGHTLDLKHPVCWDVESGIYFRRESSGILACPGDHLAHTPCLPELDPEQVYALAEAIPIHAPPLKDTGLRRAWACLRTMTPDEHMALGRDPRVQGLVWFAGLAGHGMSAGLAAAELLAEHIVSQRKLPKELDARRLLLPKSAHSLSASA